MSPPLRVLLVGAGGVARYWLPVLRARTELVGVVERDGLRLHDAARRHDLGVAAFTDLAVALAQTAPDVVANLTPPQAHRAVSETALRHGCDVITEKPMATSLPDARALAAVADETGRRLAVMQNRRYQPAIRALRAGIDAGGIGAPSQLCADLFMANRYDKAYLRDEPHPMLLEMAVHTFDQARFLAGGAEPLSVHCHEVRPAHSWFAGAPAVLATFALEDGRAFSFRGDWVAEGHATSFDAAWRVTGSRGTVVWDSHGVPVAEARPVGVPGPGPSPGAGAELVRTPWPPAPPRDETGHQAALDAILSGLETGGPIETDARDNVMTMAMVSAAIVSTRERRVVDLAELLGEAAPA